MTDTTAKETVLTDADLTGLEKDVGCCSFCNLGRREVFMLVAGPDCCICDRCVEIAGAQIAAAKGIDISIEGNQVALAAGGGEDIIQQLKEAIENYHPLDLIHAAKGAISEIGVLRLKLVASLRSTEGE